MRRTRRTSWFLLGGALLAFFFPVEGVSQPRILMDFKPQALVQKEMIHLEDIASIKGSPRSLVEKIGRLSIQTSPPLGEVLILSREDIVQKIKRNHLALPVSDWQIPEEIAVVREGRVMERSEIAGILEDHLQKIMGEEGKTIRVKEVQGLERITVPPGKLSWEVKIPPRISSGNMPVSMILFADRQKIREARFYARMEIYADVVIARNYLKRHQVVEEKDVHLVHRNILQSPPDVVIDPREVVGKRTTLSVNSQEILRKSMVEIPPLVKRGDRVTLLVENDQFKITSVGEAKEEGREGDRIKVINVTSKKEVYGRVLDAHTIKVDF
jgi:flagella basal body P-ring formation protein FlgA